MACSSMYGKEIRHLAPMNFFAAVCRPRNWALGFDPAEASSYPIRSSAADIPPCATKFVHCVRRAASRAAWIAGSSSATKIPMIAITTSSSTSVNARIAGTTFL